MKRTKNRWNTKKTLAAASITPLLLASASCGSGSSSSVDELLSGLSSIAGLPNATDGVSSATANIRALLAVEDQAGDHEDQKPEDGHGNGERPESHGTKGFQIGKSHQSADWAGKSRAACELTRMTLETLVRAADVDRMKCVLGVLDTEALIENTYDGNVHYFEISKEEHSRRVRFSATKDATTGFVTGFNMDTCVIPPDGDAYVQENHASISVDPTTQAVTIVAAGKKQKENRSGQGRVVVTGSVNTDGTWSADTGKTLTFEGKRVDEERTQSQSMTFEQDASTMAVSGWRSGADEEYSITNQLYAEAQILASETASTLQLGEGSAQFLFTRSGGENDEAPTSSSVTSWDGEMAALTDPTAGTYYTSVAAATLPAVGTVADSPFSTGEDWDCSVPDGETATTISEEDLPEAAMKECLKRDLSEHDGGFDCHQGADAHAEPHEGD